MILTWWVCLWKCVWSSKLTVPIKISNLRLTAGIVLRSQISNTCSIKHLTADVVLIAQSSTTIQTLTSQSSNAWSNIRADIISSNMFCSLQISEHRLVKVLSELYAIKPFSNMHLRLIMLMMMHLRSSVIRLRN